MSEIPLSEPDITELEVQAVVDTLRSGRMSIGPRQARFEDMVAERSGCRHGVAVSSGTAGLHLASKLLRHSDIRVTQQVYSPLSVDAMRKALADVGEARGKVIELAQRGVGRSGNQ